MAPYPPVHLASCAHRVSSTSSTATAQMSDSRRAPQTHDPSDDVAQDASSGHAGAAEPRAGEEDWLSTPERGALWGIHFIFNLATFFGRRPARWFVRVIAAWYFLFDRASKEASRDW